MSVKLALTACGCKSSSQVVPELVGGYEASTGGTEGTQWIMQNRHVANVAGKTKAP